MRVRPQHWILFLNFAEKHPELITNKFNGLQGKQKGAEIWETVCTALNALGLGEKSVMEWRRAVTDWKSKTKAKSARLRNDQVGTGGGGATTSPLTEEEERLLALIGMKAVEGDKTVPELGLRAVMEPVESDHTYIGQLWEENESPNNECGPLAVEEIPTSNIPQGEGTSNVNTKRMPTRKGSRPPVGNRNRQPIFSQELIDMNAETLSTIRQINQNVSRVAYSVERIADALCNLTSILGTQV